MIKRLTESAVVKAIAAFLLFEVLTQIYTHVRDALHIERVTNLQWLGNELVLVIIAVAVAVIFKTVNKLKDPIKGFWKSILCGSWFLLFCLAGTVSSILTYTSEGPGLKSPLELVIFAIFVLAIGFAEEILHRGVITELLARKHADTVKGRLLTIFTGSFIFSIFHISNILLGQSVENTIYQMISVFCLAIFLNTIYVKYRNLYAVILIHAALDLMTLSDCGMVKGATLNQNFTSESKTVLWSFIVCNAMYLVAAVIIFIATNKKGGKRNVQENT